MKFLKMLGAVCVFVVNGVVDCVKFVCHICSSLPEPLMTFKLHQKFINAASMCL